uniref:Peptidase M16C associated domain-containing protein n=2 Tax=Hanusia phi TaxID=3032 RepID=A0A7S0EDK3_9CRYP|mmetsp:Transcript_21683/g.49103  ORF Transcript_21683/g.49103 Transcript_21683/m.49103 type:complete len:1050 (+) Transcript_21683:130-3279(+)
MLLSSRVSGFMHTAAMPSLLRASAGIQASKVASFKLPQASFKRPGRLAPFSTLKMVATSSVDVKSSAIFQKYDIVKEDHIEEYGAKVVLFRHKKTGAEVMSVSVPDENKVFGITFRTPPNDSTGVPHILEHSVLCGSRRYPVKEPFVELLKGSMNTFLNAFTYPDRTCYPVASQNLKDFYNLINVYLDAVLHPALTPWTLKQEGWHYEIEDESDVLKYKGVVFNEMKGVYSSPDAVHGRACQQALFPDNTYGVDSGGDPTVIPKLTWENFEGFHKKFYHPSNSRIYFYGDDDVAARLELLETFLGEFEQHPKVRQESTIEWQQKRDTPWAIEQHYPSGQDGKVLMTVNWLINDKVLKPQDELALDVLDDLLMGTPVSPLYKTLRESGLGESVISDGLETVLQQATYSVGMKGVDEVSKCDEIQKLILDTLTKISNEGFDKSSVEASLNSLEFKLREFNTGGFPRGLSFMLGSLSSWLYDRDPMEPLRFEKPLAELRSRIASGEPVFEDLIKKYLINNGHRVTVKSLPDPELEEKNRKREEEELETVRKSLQQEEISKLVEETKMLKEKQQAEDPPEKLALIPSLTMDDLDKQGRNIPIAVSEEKGVKVLRHELPTNGIVYADIGLDMRVIPVDLLPLIPLFCRCLTEMGTHKRDDIALSDFIRTHTGGVYTSTSTTQKYGSGNKLPEPEVVSNLFLRGKATYAKSAQMFEVMNDIITNTNFNNQNKFKQMVLETKARLEANIVGSGHSYAAGRIGARYMVTEFVEEKMRGIETLDFIRELAKEVDKNWEGVLAKLERIRDLLVNRKNLIVNLSAEDKGFSSLQSDLEEYIQSIPLKTEDSQVVDWAKEMKKFEGKGEGFVVPTQVNYVGKGAQIFQPGEKTSGAAAVVSRHLRTTWLWDKVRVVGGAYGAMNSYNPSSGMFKYVSYRDPNLLQTLETYDQTPQFLRELSKEMSPTTLANAIIGMIGDMDAPMSPDQKGFTSMDRYLTGLTDEMRQERRDQVLSTTAKDFAEFADRLDVVTREGSIAVIGSNSALEEANANLGLELKKIL